MPLLDREGIFKAYPVAMDVKTFDGSQAVAIATKFRITAQLHGNTWEDWTQYDPHEVYGDFFVTRRDGTPNEKIVQQLAAALAWDGSFDSLYNTEWESLQLAVQITVKSEEYNGKTYYKVAWINPGDYEPKKRLGNTSDADVEALKDQLEARFRAIIGSSQAA